MVKVGIVIVNYNGEKFQNDCIASLYQMEYTDFEIIVVDSGSTDNSISLLRQQYPYVQIIECGDNVGFAKGNNIGIKRSIADGNEYTLLLNNDVVVDKKMLGSLTEKAEENIVTVPKIFYYNPSNLIWYGGGSMDWNEATGKHEYMKQHEDNYCNQERNVTYSPACCMLIHNSVFQKIGLFDEKLFMYFDDTDLCARLIDNAYKIRYIPDAYLWHKVSSSSGGEFSKIAVYYQVRNHLYFMDKYQDRISCFNKLEVKFKYIIKYLLSPFWKNHHNYKYIRLGRKDYYNMKMGRKDF